MRQWKQRVDRPVLITEARPSGDVEFDRRRKRYLLMMGVRALCIVGAASTFQFSGLLAGAFVVGALVLPWTAVLIANDRPPKEAVRFRRFLHGHRVDGPAELTAAERGDRARRVDESPPPERPGPAGEPTVIDI